MLNRIVNPLALAPAANATNFDTPQHPGIWNSYKLTSRELDFTFIPAPVLPECPTSVGLALRQSYAVITLYCPEPVDIPQEYQMIASLFGKEPEHEARLHRNKGSADEHYHFKFEEGDTEKIDSFISHALREYLMTTSCIEESNLNFRAAFDTFMEQDQNIICFENQDTAQRNTEPDRTTSLSD
ncbi:hypothetical protein [Endozoicomonas atrinae]|uniref:hypothetical protein n=1 Tax=Endozoicomonas atrinae TaxID=1333660 RepID=UPI000824FDD4|nr:hypothetical protein [Endozoicomonas atrinae]